MKRLILFALALVYARGAFAQGNPPGTYGPGGGPSGGTAPTGTNLLQNYSLNATGAQSAINLTSNPIDTHTLSWRVPAATTLLTDTVPYTNGDLHTKNANWVYQTGTFAVTSNVIYSNVGGVSLAYRSDGVSSGNQTASATEIITAASGVQNGGPCVHVQTATESGYCIQMASDIFRLIRLDSGATTILATFLATNTGTFTVKLTINGTALQVFLNGVVQSPNNSSFLTSVTDSTYTTGFTGYSSTGNATSNGISLFVSGLLPVCSIGLDSSPDGVNWTTNGAIVATDCSQSGSGGGGSASNSVVANYVRVNLSSLINIATVTVVYSGRLTQAAPVAGSAPVSNGQYVVPGEVIWIQYTTQGIGTIQMHSTANILLTNGTIQSTTWDVTCLTGTNNGGFGTGFTVTQPGWLQAVTTDDALPFHPMNSELINIYILNSMPLGGGTGGCNQNLNLAQVGTILGTWISGSTLPVSFVGTTSSFTSSWQLPGYTNVLSISNPAAGADFSFNIPGLFGSGSGARTCVQSVSFQLVTSATAANRIPVLRFQVSTGTNTSNLIYSATTAQTATTTQVYSFSPGAVAETVTGGTTVYHIVPFNNGQLFCFNAGLSTATISSLTTAIQAADQYSNIAVTTQVQQDNN